MVYEIATLHINPGSEQAFEAAVAEAAPFFKKSKGCTGLSLVRGVEAPSVYFLIVVWDSVEDHMVHFRNSPEYQEWRRLVSPHFSEAPTVMHVDPVGSYF